MKVLVTGGSGCFETAGFWLEAAFRCAARAK